MDHHMSALTQTATLPRLRLLPGEAKRVGRRPWVYANQIAMDTDAKALAPGADVTLVDEAGQPMASAAFNRHSLIAARVHAWAADQPLDANFITQRLDAALALRERLFAAPFYRLVHAEGDGLPGLVVDRLGDYLVLQPNTAAMDARLEVVLEWAEARLAPQAVVIRADGPTRALEGLNSDVRLARGELGGPVALFEGRCRFFADLMGGQKTGWFFDLRAARRQVASLAAGARVLDLYCHTGAFGIRALAEGGADSVLAIDRSREALDLAAKAALANGCAAEWTGEQGESFMKLEWLAAKGERFNIVVADPPSFVKSRKDLAVGLKAYRKLARLAAQCVASRGFLFIASCSHNVSTEDFEAEVRKGLWAAGRDGRILYAGGADADHPVHAGLPETAYLKYQIIELD